jgi:two-component system catabolic regulation response regulator CreB
VAWRRQARRKVSFAHVKTLRAKLKAVAPTLEPIRTHRGVGYALAEDLPPARPA